MSCEIRKTKNRFYRNFSISLYAFALSLFISLNGIAEDDSENDISYWLDEAEKHAYKIEDSHERYFALSFLAISYAESENFDKAYSIALRLPKDNRINCLPIIFHIQTRLGDIANALERIQNIREPELKSRCLWHIAFACIKIDISMSLKIAKQLSEPSQSTVLRRIVKESVLKGNIEQAKNILQQISDPNERIDVQYWITAAKISEEKDITKAISQINPYPEDLNFHLREIAKIKLQSGQIKKAKQIIESLPDSHNKIIGYCDLAEYYWAKDAKVNFKHYIEKAIKEIQQYSDPEMPDFINFFQASLYIRIAKLQIDAGDIKAGFATAKISLAKGKEDKLFGSEELSLFKGLGSEKAIYGLMIQAGKIEEVRKLTQREDGSFPREVAILLIGAYTRAGQDEEAEAILDSLSTPQDKFHLSLAIIEGMNQRKGNDKQQQQKP